MSATAIYYSGSFAHELEVVAQNPDGTVDLARDGEVVVEKCPVATEEKSGFCVLKPSNGSKARSARETKSPAKAKETEPKEEASENETSEPELQAHAGATASPEDLIKGL